MQVLGNATMDNSQMAATGKDKANVGYQMLAYLWESFKTTK